MPAAVPDFGVGLDLLLKLLEVVLEGGLGLQELGDVVLQTGFALQQLRHRSVSEQASLPVRVSFSNDACASSNCDACSCRGHTCSG